MKYRFETTEISIDHMTAACGDNPRYGGYTCSFRNLSGRYRHGSATFDAIALSTITNRDRWQTVAFPCQHNHNRDLDWVIDFTHPITIWNGTGTPVPSRKAADGLVEEVKEVCFRCDNKTDELMYVLAYMER